MIAAGLLHDVIEKAGVSASELQRRFGPRITALVLAVSDDDSIAGYAAGRAALRHQVAGAGEEALTLFAVDELSKLRELHARLWSSQGWGSAGPEPGACGSTSARWRCSRSAFPTRRSCANSATNWGAFSANMRHSPPRREKLAA
jgi:hypothetical protein